MPERPPETAIALRARGLGRRYGGGAPALDGLSLDVAAGELCVALGPSGSGKTTFLRLVAGFERPDAGTLDLFGERVAGGGSFTPPERRGVGMVFQDFALFPHLSVAGNAAYGLPRGPGREARVREALELTGLARLGDRPVHALSGGEQQRAALARALAPGPRLLLLDEPFSNLDASLRGRVREELLEIVRRAGATTILVTHDQEEALSIADRIAFLWEGRMEQWGTPREVYLEPRTLRVAEHVGDAIVLRLPADGGRVRPGAARCAVVIRPEDLLIGEDGTPLGDWPAPPDAARCAVVIRPEDLLIGEDGTPAEVRGREFYGHDQVLRVRMVASRGSTGIRPTRSRRRWPAADGSDLRVRVGPGEEYAALGRVALRLRRPPAVFAE